MRFLLLLVVVALVGLIWFIPRMGELFLISLRNADLLVVRGKAPIALLQDFADILTRHGVKNATIRAVRAQGGAQLVLRGVDEGTAQRLRNAFHLYPVSHLEAAPPLGERNLGQLLGVVWLAWLFAGSSRRTR